MVFNTIDFVRLINCIDLTLLNHREISEKNLAEITRICRQADTTFGSVAAICIYPEFVSEVWKNLMHSSSKIKIATVANFPEGQHKFETVIQTLQQARLDGADEIDVVMPQIDKSDKSIKDFISQCKKMCEDKMLLKIILETGALSPQEIEHYGQIAIESGADFLKTSTGKIHTGATLEAAEILLSVIKKHAQKTGKTIGLKISGGIKTVEQAFAYIHLLTKALGKEYFSPAYFRIGASSLLQEIMSCVSQNQN